MKLNIKGNIHPKLSKFKGNSNTTKIETDQSADPLNRKKKFKGNSNTTKIETLLERIHHENRHGSKEILIQQRLKLVIKPTGRLGNGFKGNSNTTKIETSNPNTV